MSGSEDKTPARSRMVIAAVAVGALGAAVLGYQVFGKPSCEQIESSVTKALDTDKGEQALALADKAPDQCKVRTAMRGRRAEALVRTGHNDEALAEGNAVLVVEPSNPYATYAVAQAQHASGAFAQARANAEAAVQRGRGPAAQLLLGVLAYKVGDYAAAREAYGALLKTDPNDVSAVYNLALVDHQLNRYRDAREGYLKVLRLDPNHIDARFNLALLTHAAGATMEARHHLQKLEELAPNDERVARLKAALAAPPPSSALVVGAPAASSNAPALPPASVSAAASR